MYDSHLRNAWKHKYVTMSSPSGMAYRVLVRRRKFPDEFKCSYCSKESYLLIIIDDDVTMH